jgi:hypothetical protein
VLKLARVLWVSGTGLREYVDDHNEKEQLDPTFFRTDTAAISGDLKGKTPAPLRKSKGSALLELLSSS